MYHQHPVGKYFIQICTTTPCHVCGAGRVVDSFLEHTGCRELGATSPDGRFTVIEVECLGACGFATPVMINEEFLESVTPETVPSILEQLR
jgi:NADH:ubiquinone oxidoreductase subunit E